MSRGHRTETARRLAATLLGGLLVVTVILACGGGRESGAPPGTPVPPGVGYGDAVDEVRVLSRDDCVALRDHQIELAVDDALVDAGGRESPERLSLEAHLRNDTRAATEAWVQRCAGRLVHDRELRCMRSATTPRTFNACGETPDAGPSRDAELDGRVVRGDG